MAYYQARSKVCRAGVTYAGNIKRPLKVQIGASNRTTDVQVDSFSVSTALDGAPSSCSLVLVGTQPAVGSDLIVSWGGQLLWGGTIVQTRARVQKLVSGTVFWQVNAVDWTWLMDRFDRVVGKFYGSSPNSIVAAILRTYTDGGFSTGYIPSSLTIPSGPNIVPEFQFVGDTVSSAISRVAKAAGAFWRLTPRKSVDLFATALDGNDLSLGNSSDIRGVSWESSFASIRTRTYMAGGGGSATAAVRPGETAIPVDECAWYKASGGRVLCGADIVTYTGKSVGSGPGSLTGCTGIELDITPGESITVLGRADDATAQTALATLLGGGRSGVSTAWFSDSRLVADEADARAAADVDVFKTAIPSLSYTTDNRFAAPGKVVSVSITDPMTISGSFRIQSVVMKPRGAVVGDAPTFEYTVTARSTRRPDLSSLLN